MNAFNLNKLSYKLDRQVRKHQLQLGTSTAIMAGKLNK